MTASAVAAAASSSSFTPPAIFILRRWRSSSWYHHHSATVLPRRQRPFSVRVTNDSSRTGLSPDTTTSEKSEADKLVDGMNFGELCNEFECISSPSVEATARQLARDILELRQGNRALGTFAVSVKYSDPVRSFTGREKYKRPLWATDALDKPTVISGQVIEHEEFWDLSASSAMAQAYFWSSRRLFSTVEFVKDITDSVKDLSSRFPTEKENMEVYPDPTGDPTKFFQRDDSFQRDAYQIALVLALLYFVVQFLKTAL